MSNDIIFKDDESDEELRYIKIARTNHKRLLEINESERNKI
jgi:hypothetical protein